MKTKTLTTALIAGLTGVAGVANISNAVNLNPDGLGQVLIYPYYTVNAGNNTLLSVVNTTSQAKAVKVRFLEGENSREVLDFNLYLSMFDVWTGGVFAVGDTGPGYLTTLDRSCTVPDIVRGTPGSIGGLVDLGTLTGNPDLAGQIAVQFRDFGYTGLNDDDGSQDLERTREGHFEIIEMGVLTDATRGSATAATHIAGEPSNCAQLNAAWAPGGYWFIRPSTDIDEPIGGLFGSAALIDVAVGTEVSYNADAIDGFSAFSNHTNPGTELPSLASANTGDLEGVQSIVFDNGVAVFTFWPTGAEAVSAIYMHDAIYNEYALDTGTNAGTEWVVTFPTKRFYVDPEFAIAPAPVEPFTSVFGSGGACEDVGITIYDREEDTPVGNIDFSPSLTPLGPQLCWESQVITFNDSDPLDGSSDVLGSRLTQNIASPYENGWVNLQFWQSSGTLADHASRPSNPSPDPTDAAAAPSPHIYRGLPVTGFRVTNQINSNAAPGSLANYAGLYRHRATRNICVANSTSAIQCS